MLRLPQTLEASDSTSLLSEDYSVSVNGQPCEVRACRVSAMPFGRPWTGQQRPLEQTELASYVFFESDGPVELKILPSFTCQKALVRPLTRKIQVCGNDGTLAFTLTEPGSYVLELDGCQRALHIFFNAPENYPEKEQATYFFGPGIHFANLIELKDNDVVYIDRDAIVYGGLSGRKVHNVSILGQGVLDGSHLERKEKWGAGLVSFTDSSEIRIEEVILQDSPLWTTGFTNCENVTLQNIKIVGQWRYDACGIVFANCRHCTASHSFVRSFGDALAVKGYPQQLEQPCADICFEHCVCWSDWGRTCVVGNETWASEIADIRFNGCDLLHNSETAIGVLAGGDTPVHDIVFENIRVEVQASHCQEQLQATEDDAFKARPYALNLLCVNNRKSCLFHEAYAPVRNIAFRHIQVRLEERAPRPHCELKSFSDDDKGFGHIWTGRKDLPPAPRVTFGKIVFDHVAINDDTLGSLAELPVKGNAEAMANVAFILK